MTFYKDSKNGRTYLKPCSKVDFTTGKRCPNGASSLVVIDQFINDVMWKEIKPAMNVLNEQIAKNTEILDTTSSRVKELTNQKKDINKQLDKLLDLMLTSNDHRFKDKYSQLQYRLQEVEKELTELQSGDSDGKDWGDVFLELNKEIHILPYKGKSKDPKVINTFIKKYIDPIVYKKNDLEPDKPYLKVHYTETVQQAMEVYKQYRKEMNEKLEARKQKAIL